MTKQSFRLTKDNFFYFIDRKKVSLFLFLLLIFAGMQYAEPVPDPYLKSDQPVIGPSPTPVMDQVFWIEINESPENILNVRIPVGIRLLDRTKPGNGRKRTRIYLRSSQGIENESISIDIKEKKPISVPIHVLNYRQDIEDKIKLVPGINPEVRKQGRSYYTDDQVKIALENLSNYPELGEQIEFPTGYEDKTDEQVFFNLPSWDIPRQCYSDWPCPFCGEKIYSVSGFYPWKRDNEYPFKLQCPLCNNFFPTNDFFHDDFTSGEFPDDGWGWNFGSGERKDNAGFIAHYNHHNIWREFGDKVHRLALRYLLFGDEDAAHKTAVLLSRMAYVYPGMNMRWQQVKPGYLRPGRLLLDGNWERNQILVPVCRSYDAIFDYIEKDTALVEFLHRRDTAINTPDDVKALIDTYLIQVFGWDWMQRELSGGNMGAREEDMAQFAVCANMGAMSDRWIEELFTHAYNSGSNVGGFDDETLINTTTREGPVCIAALGYAYDYLIPKSDMAEILSKVNSPVWHDRSNLYDPLQYPKFRAEFDTWIDFIVAGQFRPGYGDSGGVYGAKFPNGLPESLCSMYKRAYSRWPTNKIARAIYRSGKQIPDLFEPDVWADIDSQVQQAGPEPLLESRVMDGVGFVFLESRSYETILENRAGITIRYGYGRGHHHQDNLNIEMFSGGLSVAPELGYPTWTHPMGNTSHVAHHNTGMIDRSPQYNGSISHGDLELFSSAPEASFADVSSQPDGFPNNVYRRAVCLANAPEGNVYLVDILRMAGGTVRTCCFHSPPYDSYQTNLSFGHVSRENLDVGKFERGLASNIVNPQFAESDGDAWADFTYRGDKMHMRMHYVGEKNRRYITAECAKTDIPPIRYFFAEEEQKNGASEFISIWQPYQYEPFIKNVEHLDVGGENSGGFAPVALRITLAGGQVDTFFYSFDPYVPIKLGDLEFMGSFGYWSEHNGEFRALHLVNGSYLHKDREGVTDMPPPFRARITAMDYTANIITLDRTIPANIALKDQLVYFKNDSHRSAYHVVEKLSDTTMKLDLNSILYRSKMVKIGEDNGQIVCEIPPPIEKVRGFKPGYYNGTTLTGEDLRSAYSVMHIENDTIHLDRAVKESDFPDVDGDGRRMVRMYEISPGDEVTVYRSVYKKGK
ncbi:MAG: heparinase II/III family protein [Candidatus Latescibacteria bacterium]|nr:heparinase II/III family protein [Candidatus Latescibacterota bacterium]